MKHFKIYVLQNTYIFAFKCIFSTQSLCFQPILVKDTAERVVFSSLLSDIYDNACKYLFQRAYQEKIIDLLQVNDYLYQSCIEYTLSHVGTEVVNINIGRVHK
jgi:hypothetical protein